MFRRRIFSSNKIIFSKDLDDSPINIPNEKTHIEAKNEIRIPTQAEFDLEDPNEDKFLSVHLLAKTEKRPDFNLLADPYAGQWLKDYTLAVSKYMLGEARGKFATISSPQGGTSLNGDSLKADAMAEMEKLEMDLANYVDGSKPLSFVIG